jgi:Ubiquitin carboxyl-terminal hydrolase, family 1
MTNTGRVLSIALSTRRLDQLGGLTSHNLNGKICTLKTMAQSKRWIPLESNPEVLNAYVEKLGLNTSEYAFCDIYGLDKVMLRSVRCMQLENNTCTCKSVEVRRGANVPHLLPSLHQELLGMVPQPVLAVVLLFPITSTSEDIKASGVCYVPQELQEIVCMPQTNIAAATNVFPASFVTQLAFRNFSSRSFQSWTVSCIVSIRLGAPKQRKPEYVQRARLSARRCTSCGRRSAMPAAP